MPTEISVAEMKELAAILRPKIVEHMRTNKQRSRRNLFEQFREYDKRVVTLALRDLVKRTILESYYDCGRTYYTLRENITK